MDLEVQEALAKGDLLEKVFEKRLLIEANELAPEAAPA
jgi:hypothetical protein